MALSAWLTRGEWNAAFFAGALFDPTDLSDQMRKGVCALHQHGYTTWRGVLVADPRDPGSVRKNRDLPGASEACTTEGDNSECLAEIMLRTIDYKGRAQEVLVWLDRHPHVDFPVLRALCLDYTCAEVE